jgi:hypothetical protein
MTSPATDDEVDALAAQAKPFTLVVLRWTDRRRQDGADAVEREHQRRLVGLRADGTIAILSPVLSETVAGIALLTVGVDEARAIIADDPCVRAGMQTFEAYDCLGFPGDALPG